MKVKEVKEIIDNSEFEKNELLDLDSFIQNRILNVTAEETIQECKDRRFSSGVYCIYCNSLKIVKNGRTTAGKQRYKCKCCSRSFVYTTGTMLDSSNLSVETWILMIQCLLDNKPLRETADLCGITLPTAFYNRHKIMNALENSKSNIQLSGIAECDDTSLPISYSGNHNKQHQVNKLPRKAYKRARKNSFRIPDQITDRVQIAVAADRSGNIFVKLARIGTTTMDRETVIDVYSKHLSNINILCTDQNGAYNYLARELGCQHYAFGSKSKQKRGLYHINHVNYVHSCIKEYWHDHHGISVKYIDHYIHLVAYYVEHKHTTMKDFFCDIFCALCNYRRKNCTCTDFY